MPGYSIAGTVYRRYTDTHARTYRCSQLYVDQLAFNYELIQLVNASSIAWRRFHANKGLSSAAELSKVLLKKTG